jgi:hypothetical protein
VLPCPSLCTGSLLLLNRSSEEVTVLAVTWYRSSLCTSIVVFTINCPNGIIVDVLNLFFGAPGQILDRPNIVSQRDWRFSFYLEG